VQQPHSVQIHTVEFTAVEKQFIIGAKFQVDEIVSNSLQSGTKSEDLSALKDSFHMIMIYTLLHASDLPTKVDFEKEEEIDLTVVIPFPGTLLVRKQLYLVSSPSIPHPDDDLIKGKPLDQGRRRRKKRSLPQVSNWCGMLQFC